MSEVLLELRHVCVSFNENTVVHNLNMNVEKGKTTAIVGESGSGKSVTALAILGLLPSSASVTGEICFENCQLLSMPEKKKRLIRGRKIAMIFQEPMTSLNPVFTICEQISETVLLTKKISRRGVQTNTQKLLDEVGIPVNRIHSYPHEFSGGMRQRVMIAMALANEPSLLIADEPTTALDATTAKQIVELLFAAKGRRKMSMLFVSHNLGLVASVADEICVMRSGHIVESGTTLQVLRQPENEYTKSLLACQPSITRRQKRLTTIPLDP